MIKLIQINDNRILISNVVKTIETLYPKKINPMSPLWHFVWIAKDNMQFYCNENINDKYSYYWFDLYDTNINDEFLDIAKKMNKFNEQVIFKCKLRKIQIGLHINKTNNNHSLILKTIYKDYFSIYEINNNDFPAFSNGKIGIDYHLYENLNIWNYKRSKKSSKAYKCTMKDFFYFQKESLERTLFCKLFDLWGSEYNIWKDLSKDYKRGTVYSAIPLDIIFKSHNRKELITLRYGNENAYNRNNRETIGKGIFLARVKRIIEPNDFNLIMNISEKNLKNTFIGRDKREAATGVYDFLINKYSWIKKYSCVLFDLIWDCIVNKIQIRLNFKNEDDFIKWKLQVYLKINTHKNRMHFNKNYPINQLNIDDFSIIKTTKDLIKEFTKQKMDLTYFIKHVNQGNMAFYKYSYHHNNYLLLIGAHKNSYRIVEFYKNTKEVPKNSKEYKYISKLIHKKI